MVIYTACYKIWYHENLVDHLTIDWKIRNGTRKPKIERKKFKIVKLRN